MAESWSGELDERGEYHGEGVLTVDGKVVYEGTYDHGKTLNGYATGLRRGTENITCEVVDGNFNGTGFSTQSIDGKEYRCDGEFKDGKFTGSGTYRSKSGVIYEGEWVNNRRHGKGHHTDADGKVLFEGTFHEDAYWNGSGTRTCKNGTDTGTFEEGKLVEGKRVFDDDIGSYENGTFRNNEFHKGVTLRRTKTYIYEGEWFAGYPHGHGRMTILEENRYVEGQFWFGALCGDHEGATL